MSERGEKRVRGVDQCQLHGESDVKVLLVMMLMVMVMCERGDTVPTLTAFVNFAIVPHIFRCSCDPGEESTLQD